MIENRSKLTLNDEKDNNEMMDEFRLSLYKQRQALGKRGLKQEVCVTLVETLQEIISEDRTLDSKFSEPKSCGLVNLAWVIRYMLHGAELSDDHVQDRHRKALDFLQKGNAKDNPSK